MPIDQDPWFTSLGTPEWPGSHLREVRRDRAFRIPPAEVPAVVADAVHSTAHFLLSDPREDGATIARRTQFVSLAERIELSYRPGEDAGTTVIAAVLRPLTVMSAGVDGRRELDRLFALIEEQVGRRG